MYISLLAIAIYRHRYSYHKSIAAVLTHPTPFPKTHNLYLFLYRPLNPLPLYSLIPSNLLYDCLPLALS
jgi:hypothetical protein